MPGAGTALAYLRERRSDVHSERLSSQFRWHALELRRAIRTMVDAAALSPGAEVLDYGCADRPYRAELPPSAHYVGADLKGNPRADVTLDADGRVALEDATFDLVLSTQVLEHVENPDLYLAECRRLAKPGASLVLSTHGAMYYHRDPEDYWRWTRAGLAKLVTGSGFDVVQMMGVLGPAAAGLQIFQDSTIWKLPRRLQKVYAAGMQLVIRGFDRTYDEEARLENGLTIVVRAVRP